MNRYQPATEGKNVSGREFQSLQRRDAPRHVPTVHFIGSIKQGARKTFIIVEIIRANLSL